LYKINDLDFCLEGNISETVRDRDKLGSKEPPVGNGLYGKSNGHTDCIVTDDVT